MFAQEIVIPSDNFPEFYVEDMNRWYTETELAATAAFTSNSFNMVGTFPSEELSLVPFTPALIIPSENCTIYESVNPWDIQYQANIYDQKMAVYEQSEYETCELFTKSSEVCEYESCMDEYNICAFSSDSQETYTTSSSYSDPCIHEVKEDPDNFPQAITSSPQIITSSSQTMTLSPQITLTPPQTPPLEYVPTESQSSLEYVSTESQSSFRHITPEPEEVEIHEVQDKKTLQLLPDTTLECIQMCDLTNMKRSTPPAKCTRSTKRTCRQVLSVKSRTVTSRFCCIEPGCNHTFKRHPDMLRHAKQHNSTQVHKCDKCGVKFSRADAIRRHEKKSCPKIKRRRRVSY